MLLIAPACALGAGARGEAPSGAGQSAPDWTARLPDMPPFDSKRAMAELTRLATFGQRFYGAPRRPEALDMLDRAVRQHTGELRRQTFAVTEQASGQTYQLTNIVGRLHPDATRRVLLGSHFDTRLWAEEEPDRDRRDQPIMGANDGTSGVAVVLEALRAIASSPVFGDVGVDVVLFDGEEFGRPGNADYFKGSAYFAEHARELYPDRLPMAAIILDMVGDRDLYIKRERSSNGRLSRWVNDIFFGVGRRHAPSAFSDDARSTILDDHTPLQQLGVPAILVIDLDYPHWHTQQDTLDKVSEASLAAVGHTLIEAVYRIAFASKS